MKTTSNSPLNLVKIDPSKIIIFWWIQVQIEYQDLATLLELVASKLINSGVEYVPFRLLVLYK